MERIEEFKEKLAELLDDYNAFITHDNMYE